MKKILILLSVALISSCQPERTAPEYVLVIHGGAGGKTKKNISPEKEQEYIRVLELALATGSDILKNDGSSLDAVEAAIRIMEDSPLFNAGKGAVFNALGKNELDASIMDGANLKAGAVAGVQKIKNPISAARLIMDSSRHVMLIAKGAEVFASANGLEIVDSSYFIRQRKIESNLSVKSFNAEYGTVGAVALDKKGNLAAGTSTGGMSGKMQGRIGDSPIIGAGTYADNATCAVSATGHGEYFIRNVVAYDISALINYRRWPLERAVKYIIHEKLGSMNVNGGMIAVDKEGNISMEFNTYSMTRGYIKSNGEKQVTVFEN